MIPAGCWFQTLFEYWGQPSVGTVWYFMAGSQDLKKRVKELHPDKVLSLYGEPFFAFAELSHSLG